MATDDELIAAFRTKLSSRAQAWLAELVKWYRQDGAKTSKPNFDDYSTAAGWALFQATRNQWQSQGATEDLAALQACWTVSADGKTASLDRIAILECLAGKIDHTWLIQAEPSIRPFVLKWPGFSRA